MVSSIPFQWSGCGGPISDLRIQEVERLFGVSFPRSFLDIVRECDGGDPGDVCFKLKHPGGDLEWTYSFGKLLSFREPMPREVRRRVLAEPDAWQDVTGYPWLSIEAFLNDLPPGMDAGLVPFSENGGGDFLCFDYRQNRGDHDPPVVIWLHEFLDDGPVVRLADTFESFLTKLGPCEPAGYFGPLAHLNQRDKG